MPNLAHELRAHRGERTECGIDDRLAATGGNPRGIDFITALGVCGAGGNISDQVVEVAGHKSLIEVRGCLYRQAELDEKFAWDADDGEVADGDEGHRGGKLAARHVNAAVAAIVLLEGFQRGQRRKGQCMMVAQALQMIAVAATMVVERGLRLGGAIARDRKVGGEILEFEVERDCARGDSRGANRGRVLERVERAATHRAAVLLGDLEIAAVAWIDVTGRALEENRYSSRMFAGGGRAFDFVHREAGPIARVEQVILAQHDTVARIVHEERDWTSVRAVRAQRHDFGVSRPGVVGGKLNLPVRTHQAAIDSERKSGGGGAERRGLESFWCLNDGRRDLCGQRALPFEVAA